MLKELMTYFFLFIRMSNMTAVQVSGGVTKNDADLH